MESNPIIDRQKEAEEEYKKKESFRYPFRVVCVYTPGDGWDFPVFHETKKYCSENHLTFSAREYNFERFPEDMAIFRTLAFHIYHGNYVQETQYYDTDPIHKIQLIVWAYEDLEREKAKARQKRQEKWDKMKETLNSVFTWDHFKKKPALDPENSQKKERFGAAEKNKKNNLR
jgi:hypothetical protein